MSQPKPASLTTTPLSSPTSRARINRPYRPAHSDITIAPGWAAINHLGTSPSLTPQIPTTPQKTRHTASITNLVKRKRRNPVVAEYLGLSAFRTHVQLPHLQSPASLPVMPTPVSSTRERIQKAQREMKDLKERCIAERMSMALSDLRRPLTPKNPQQDKPVPPQEMLQPEDALISSHTAIPYPLIHNLTTSAEQANHGLSPYTQSGKKTAWAPASETQLVPPIPTCVVQDVIKYCDDDELDEIFESVDVEHFANNKRTIHNYVPNTTEEPVVGDIEDDTFNDSLEDDDLLILISELSSDSCEENDTSHNVYPPSDMSSQWLDTGMDVDVLSSEMFDPRTSNSPSSKFVSPMKRQTGSVLCCSIDESRHRKVIIRPKFPGPVHGRSPIIGLSSNCCLRTCFRVGEAINAGRNAVKGGKSVMLELYARVWSSSRNSTKQNFVLCDVYHERLPHINAVYNAKLWQSVQQFDLDSARLLQGKKLCRCIGKMKRDGSGWVLDILSIWEAKWEDITWVEGILNFSA